MCKSRTVLSPKLPNTPIQDKMDKKVKKLHSKLTTTPHNTSSYLVKQARTNAKSNLLPSIDLEFMTLGGSMMDLMKNAR